MAHQSKPQPASNGIVTMARSAKGSVYRAAGLAQDLTLSALSSSKRFLDQYPPLKAFVYSLAAASAIPTSVFLGYAGATGAVCLGVAGTGVALVQGGLLAVGGFFLFWWLLGALCVAALATFWFSVAYFSYQVMKRIEGSQ